MLPALLSHNKVLYKRESNSLCFVLRALLFFLKPRGTAGQGWAQDGVGSSRLGDVKAQFLCPLLLPKQTVEGLVSMRG